MKPEWLDRVLTTPVIGIQIDPQFSMAGRFRERIGSFMDDLLREGKSITHRDTDGWGVLVLESKGYIYSFKYDNLIAEFQYTNETKHDPGKLPTPIAASVQPYSTLLKACQAGSEKMLGTVLDGKLQLRVSRIGVMARVAVPFDDAPPGLKKAVSQLSGNWPTTVTMLKSKVTSTLTESDDRLDRCHHNVDVQPQEHGQLDFILDWQRLFKNRLELTRVDQFAEELTRATDTALEYFAEVGDGGIWVS